MKESEPKKEPNSSPLITTGLLAARILSISGTSGMAFRYRVELGERSGVRLEKVDTGEECYDERGERLKK